MGRPRVNEGNTTIKTISVGEDINSFLKLEQNVSRYIKELINNDSKYLEFKYKTYKREG